LLRDLPDLLKVDREIRVDQDVPHACDIAPADMRTLIASRYRDVLDCLSDDLELPHDGVLWHWRVEECVTPTGNVALDPADRVENVV